MRRRIILGFGLFLFLLMVGLAVFRPSGSPELEAILDATEPSVQGFKKASLPAQIIFPRDFGPHPEFQTEWWYYTGNLADQNGRRFGYQFTIFRRALVPPALVSGRESDLAADQVYLAHIALTDVTGGEHYAYEDLARGAGGIAGASASPYHVWLNDLSVKETGPGRYRLLAAIGEINIDLTLTAVKDPVLQGIDGYSQKGPDPGNASYYYSQTRLETTGIVSVSGRSFTILGSSWKDHEYSTSALGTDQVGWDWFAFQFDDGAELKVFQLRKTDGSIDKYSGGSFVRPDGTVVRLSEGDFSIEVLDTWRSPQSKAVYPARWVVAVPSLELRVEAVPLLADQELNVSYTYWEGAVSLAGFRNSVPVSGFGYVELTGYAGSMAGEF